MIATLLLGTFAVLFAFLAKYNNFKYGIEISFFLIFLFLAFRYNFGNDYKEYYTVFYDITNNININLQFETYGQVIEPGWIILCWLFKPFGFYSLIVFHSFLYCIIYYYFFKKYVPKNLYWLSIFIFIFDPTFLLIQLSALRQALAAIIIIYSYQYIYRKKIVLFILFLVSASLFHISALFFLPAYLLSFIKLRINNITNIFIFFSFLVLIFFGKLLGSPLSTFISNYFERYDSYKLVEGQIGTGFGLAYHSLLLLLTLHFSKFQKKETAFLFNLSIVNFFILPFSIVISITSRLIYYFQPALLVSFPVIINNIKIKPLKTLLIITIIAYSLRSYYSFLNNDVWQAAYLDYRTIFSVIL